MYPVHYCTVLYCTHHYNVFPLPQVQVYCVETVRAQLQMAASWYLEKFVDLSQPNKVTLPKLLQWYGRDLAPTTPRLLEWIAANLGEPKVQFLSRAETRLQH